MEDNGVRSSTLADDELIKMLRTGNSEAGYLLYDRYKNYVKAIASKYYIPGSDREDAVQEGMIGLMGAVRDYNPSGDASFRTFARLCIERRLNVAITAATGKKHSMLNNAVSLSVPADGETADNAGTDISDGAPGPEDVVVEKESYSLLAARLAELLSPMEYKTVMMRLDGMSYDEIAKELGKGFKSVDNAVQRVKQKLQKLL